MGNDQTVECRTKGADRSTAFKCVFLQRFQRETEVQRQMFAVLFGAGCEGSLHFFGEGAGDGESEAGAALVARIVWRVKTLEELRHVIQR